jgi:hypothetical protein
MRTSLGPYGEGIIIIIIIIIIITAIEFLLGGGISYTITDKTHKNTYT